MWSPILKIVEVYGFEVAIAKLEHEINKARQDFKESIVNLPKRNEPIEDIRMTHLINRKAEIGIFGSEIVSLRGKESLDFKQDTEVIALLRSCETDMKEVNKMKAEAEAQAQKRPPAKPVHEFQCEKDHFFYLALELPIPLDKLADLLGNIKCPQCQTEQINISAKQHFII